jgi:hypothetical protein
MSETSPMTVAELQQGRVERMVDEHGEEFVRWR